MKRRAISPFIATAVLIAATIVIGGLLYTQFKQAIDYSMYQPSINILDARAHDDGKMLVLTLKNDGAKSVTVDRIDVYIGSSHYVFTSTNSTFTPSSTIDPGATVTAVLSSSTPIFNSSSAHIVISSQDYSRGLTVPIGF